MSNANPFADAPPAYSKAPQEEGHLAAPAPSRSNGNTSDYSSDDEEDRSGVPADERATMEEEQWPLPDGWRREFDSNSEHTFYVDTKASPPRSIWVHPYNDVSCLRPLAQLGAEPPSLTFCAPQPDFLATIPDSENPHKQSEYSAPSEAPPPVSGDIKGDVKSHHQQPQASAVGASSSSSGPHASGSGTTQQQQRKPEERSLGRKMKDKLTGSSHDERVQQRKKQQEEEMKAYQQHLMRRKQILEAQRSGRYQTVYAAPSTPYRRTGYGQMGYPGVGGMYGRGGYGMGYGGGYGGYGGGYGGGMYGRRGMGMGGPMAIGGGLLGGMLLGDMMF